jgi:hypothetical protein
MHVVPARFGGGGIVGGAERYAFEPAQSMVPAVQTTRGAFGNADSDETLVSLRICTLPCPWDVRGQRSIPVSLPLLRLLRDADIVHCHQRHVLTGSHVAPASRALGRRVFVSHLGGGGWNLPAKASTDACFHGHLHLSQFSCRVLGQKGYARARGISGGVDTVKLARDPSVGCDGGVVPPNEPVVLSELLHPGEAAAMSRAGRCRVLGRFACSAMVRRCLDAYRGVPVYEPVAAVAVSRLGSHKTRTARSVRRTGLTAVRKRRRLVHRG